MSSQRKMFLGETASCRCKVAIAMPSRAVDEARFRCKRFRLKPNYQQIKADIQYKHLWSYCSLVCMEPMCTFKERWFVGTANKIKNEGHRTDPFLRTRNDETCSRYFEKTQPDRFMVETCFTKHTTSFVWHSVGGLISGRHFCDTSAIHPEIPPTFF